MGVHLTPLLDVRGLRGKNCESFFFIHSVLLSKKIEAQKSFKKIAIKPEPQLVLKNCS